MSEFNPEGQILNFYCELPHNLSAREIGIALLELDVEISAMREPPVAEVFTHFTASSQDQLESELEDYRRFYVNFEPHATAEDMHQAVGIVMSAMARLRGENPSA